MLDIKMDSRKTRRLWQRRSAKRGWADRPRLPKSTKVTPSERCRRAHLTRTHRKPERRNAASARKNRHAHARRRQQTKGGDAESRDRATSRPFVQAGEARDASSMRRWKPCVACCPTFLERTSVGEDESGKCSKLRRIGGAATNGTWRKSTENRRGARPDGFRAGPAKLSGARFTVLSGPDARGSKTGARPRSCSIGIRRANGYTKVQPPPYWCVTTRCTPGHAENSTEDLFQTARFPG